MSDPIGNLTGSSLKLGGNTSALDPNAIPGFLPSSKGGFKSSDYRVRYQMFNMKELGDIAELEKIETKAFRDEGTYVLDKKNYVFMDTMYFIVQYVEKITD